MEKKIALSKYEKTKNWDAGLYDGKHSYVSQYGESLLKLLDPKPNEIICDIGCGTGDLAKQILESGAQVLGIDKSESMINEAKNKYSDIQFEVQDIDIFLGIFQVWVNIHQYLKNKDSLCEKLFIMTAQPN